MSSLATISSGELRSMSVRELTDGLAAMSPTAIDRFRRMRRLSTDHNQALDAFLRQNPEKRLTSANSDSTGAKPVKAKTKSPARSQPPVQKEKTTDDGYVQLWIRMRAWWDGVELEQPNQAPAGKAPGQQMAIHIDADDEANYRLQIVQQLWGEAISLPGGKSFALDLLKTAKPTKEMTIADLTSGLGAGTLQIAQAIGATVNGFEVDKELAEEGQRLSQMDQQSPQISISHLDVQQMDAALGKEQYDIIVARDFFYKHQDRKEILSAIAEALKPGGSLIFTDFCLADRSTEKKDILDWRQAEPQKPSPGTVDEYRDIFGSLRFEVRSVDDITSMYVPTIQAGWKSIVEAVKTGSHSRGYVDSLMQEGNIWLSRSKALESGQLRAIQFRAIMQKGPKRSITDSMSID